MAKHFLRGLTQWPMALFSRHAAMVLAAFMLAGLGSMARGDAAPAGPRTVMNLDSDWKFIRQDVDGAQAPAFDDSAWTALSLPHTWNNMDGEDGGNNYYKGACWYRRHITLDKPLDGKTAYLRFEGANRTTTAYVNGKELGSHTGGFAAFVFDATSALKPGDNIIAVKVDNSDNPDSPPLSGDFTFFGGLYRPVELIITNNVAISPLESGSPGVLLSVQKVTAESADVIATVYVRNTTAAPYAANVTLAISDHAGKQVGTVNDLSPVPANATTPRTLHITMTNPHLWAGKPDPYLYTATVVLSPGKSTEYRELDSVALNFGVRTMVVDPTKGFLLNGKPYNLHGVCRHQDWIDKGWAIGPKEMDADMANILELGATCIRLAHYQHAQYFYDLCDKNGIVVWAELPMVNAVTNAPAYQDNAKQQLTELIMQNQHHASIAMWSMANEVVYKTKVPPYPFVGQLSELAHKLDPTRMTTQAIMGNGPNEPVTDIQGFNIYMGWYYGKYADLGPFIENHSSFAISEYGAGGNPAYHSETPKKGDHTEEYECIFHETYWRAIRNQPHIWGTFLWALNDFASDGRTEGGFFGRNDKGLISYDRTIKKDVFYFYKAQWATDAMVYITSRRFDIRGISKIPAKIYTNAPDAELFVNGVSQGKKTADMGICLWPQITLNEGPNKIEAKAIKDGKEVTDTITWIYKPGAPKFIKDGKEING